MKNFIKYFRALIIFVVLLNAISAYSFWDEGFIWHAVFNVTMIFNMLVLFVYSLWKELRHKRQLQELDKLCEAYAEQVRGLPDSVKWTEK